MLFAVNATTIEDKVSAEKASVVVASLNSYVTLSSFSWDQDHDKFKIAPEVLHRSYNTETDMWSIGVITYILLCGSRPFWAWTESRIFRSLLRANPNFDDAPWPISAEAKDFVKRLLNKDYKKRMTTVQTLTHPWLRNEQRQIPLDMLAYRLIKLYLRTSLKQAALKALSKAITDRLLVVAEGRIASIDSNTKVHHVILGRSCWKVWVDKVLVEKHGPNSTK